LSALLLLAAALSVACGKKGPPLPPLVKVPVAPGDLTAERRGSDVTVQFTIPATNTDNTKPANIERVVVYALTAPTSVGDDVLLKRGTVVGSVAVKAPRDPNATVDADESEADVEPPEGLGLDQGAVGRVADQLTPAARVPADLAPKPEKTPKVDDEHRPLVGPLMTVPSRIYAGVGVNKRGKKGPISRRVAIPLVPPPPAPSAPEVNYDEKSIHVTWTPVAGDDTSILPSHPLGVPVPQLTYHVYEVAPHEDGSGSASLPLRLTTTALGQQKFEDSRMDWGRERCYAVRTLESFGDLKVESEQSDPACVTLTDTFPPAPPHGLRAVGTEGAISLIWDASTEADLAGYLVVRGTSPESLEPVTPAPIPDTNFRDTVPTGAHYFYAVVAVDKTGNKSGPSERVDETARH
jgi:hypothetical protein